MTVTAEHPNGQAPSLDRYRMGAMGGRVAQAWQYAWDHMSTEEWTGAREIAERAAARYGIKAVSLMTHMIRMAKQGALDVDYKLLPIEASRNITLKDGTRKASTFTTRQKCTFYRIPR